MDEHWFKISCSRCKFWLDVRVLGASPDDVERIFTGFTCERCIRQKRIEQYV